MADDAWVDDARARVLQLLPRGLPPDSVAADLAASFVAAASDADGARTAAAVDAGEGHAGGSRATVLRRAVDRPCWAWLPLAWEGYGRAAVVHAVGDAIFACLGCRQPVLFTPHGRVTAGQQWALGRVSRSAVAAVVAGGPVEWARRRAILAAEARPAAVHRTGSDVVTGRPAGLDRRVRETRWITPTHRLPPERVARDLTLRRRLGFLPTDRVVLAVGPSTRRARHGLLVWAVTILAMLDRRWKLLLSGDGPEVWRLVRFARSTPRAELLTVARVKDASLTYAQLLAAADIAVDTTEPHGEPPTALYASVAAEVPTLSTATGPLVDAALRLPADVQPKALAQTLLDLSDGVRLQQHVEAVTRAAGVLRDTDPVAQWRHLLSRYGL
ncbi:MAG: hypothetical protein ACK4PI_03815 [Tepidisphaerales bacterium]